MPDDVKISEMSEEASLDNSAQFPYVQSMNGNLTTLKAPLSQIGTKLNEGMTFSNLQTTSKTIVGAINEIDTKTTLVKSASGSLIHITDGGDNIPMKSLESEIVAVESGSGEKSPTNPYTISGFDSGVVKVSNHSTVVETLTQVYVDASGIVTNSLPSFPYRCVIARVNQGEQYTYSVNGVATTIPVMAFFDKYPLVGTQSYNSSRLLEQNATFTSPINGYVFIRGSGDFNEVNQMVATGTNTEYEQGNTYTFAFGQTVYGGHFDNKGNLVVTHGYIASYNGETINEPWISSMDNYVPNTSPSTGAQVVYPLTTPNTLAITSQDIPTLSGVNNIFSNCGDTAIEYFTSSADDLAALFEVLSNS